VDEDAAPDTEVLASRAGGAFSSCLAVCRVGCGVGGFVSIYIGAAISRRSSGCYFLCLDIVKALGFSDVFAQEDTQVYAFCMALLTFD
jgi:hypothetical protein